MHHKAILSLLLVMMAPLAAALADPRDDDIVIISVKPRDPSVKPEILLTPAKPREAETARRTSESPPRR